MTIEDAIKILQVAKSEIEWSAPLDYQVAFDMAIVSLKKQTPLGIRFNGDDAVCPKCGADAEWKKYCEECGQRLIEDE